MWKIVLISLALVQAIQCRTNEDVINDFEPVFRERHEAFTALKNLTESTMTPIFKNFQQEIFRLGEDLMATSFPESVKRIYNNITEYIKEVGLAENPELTKKCMEYLNRTLEDVNYVLVGQGSSCSGLPTSQLGTIYSKNYTDLLQKLENEHTVLNATREECVKLSTPFEVQTCVINDLYTFYIPYLKDVTTYTNNLIQDWTNKLNRIQNEIAVPCYELIQNDLKNYEKQIIDDTKLCIWFIPKPSN